MQSVMTAKQASTEYFGGSVSYWKLLELAKTGQLPHFKVGSRVFFRWEALDEWVKQQETDIRSQPDPNGVIRLVAAQ